MYQNVKALFNDFIIQLAQLSLGKKKLLINIVLKPNIETINLTFLFSSSIFPSTLFAFKLKFSRQQSDGLSTYCQIRKAI